MGMTSTAHGLRCTTSMRGATAKTGTVSAVLPSLPG